jgi:hypothetical protein
MKKNIFKVRPDRVEAEEIAVKSVRHPGQWMPVGLIVICERPHSGCPRQARFYLSVFRDIQMIVIVNKAIVDYGTVGHKDGCRQRQAKEENLTVEREGFDSGRRR